jgi:hypothetical protein
MTWWQINKPTQYALLGSQPAKTKAAALRVKP